MTEFTLFSGRPQGADALGRLKKELDTYDLLDQLQIPYFRVDHPAVDTIAECSAIGDLLGVSICKNLFLTNAQKSKFYLLAMPGDKKFRTAILSKQISSSRLSFAGPEYLQEFLDLTPGSVSILGLKNDTGCRVQLLLDRDVVQEQEFFGCHPCINTSSLKLATADLLNTFLPYTGHSPIIVDL